MGVFTKEEVEAFNRFAAEQGALVSLEQLRIQGKIPEKYVGFFYKHAFKILIPAIVEARKECRHIEQALIRMESVARRESVRFPGRVHSEGYQQINLDMIALKGWITSLLETYTGFLAWLAPALVFDRIRQLGNALWNLHTARTNSADPLGKNASLFDEINRDIL